MGGLGPVALGNDYRSEVLGIKYSCQLIGPKTPVAKGFVPAQLTSDYVTADGVRLPARRRAYTRGTRPPANPEMLMVSIDTSEVVFARKDQ